MVCSLLSPPLSVLSPATAAPPPSDRSEEGVETACDLVDPSRVYLPGGQEIRHILGSGARGDALSLPLLARSLVVKSRDFFLRAVYGNVDAADAFVCKFGGVT